MKFLRNVSVEDNIITYNLKADYNDPLTSEEEQEIETLHDYVRRVRFADIDFSGYVDISGGTPVVSDAPPVGGDSDAGAGTPAEDGSDTNGGASNESGDGDAGTSAGGDAPPEGDTDTADPAKAGAAGGNYDFVRISGVLPKEYIIDENLDISFSFDVSRVHDKELTDKLNTAILLGQAKIAVFGARLEEKIRDILEQMRKEDNRFEGTSTTVL